MRKLLNRYFLLATVHDELSSNTILLFFNHSLSNIFRTRKKLLLVIRRPLTFLTEDRLTNAMMVGILK